MRTLITKKILIANCNKYLKKGSIVNEKTFVPIPNVCRKRTRGLLFIELIMKTTIQLFNDQNVKTILQSI